MIRQDRWLDERPPHPGVYRHGQRFVAAIPFGEDWWEGPLRDDVDRAVADLDAERALRAELAEAAGR